MTTPKDKSLIHIFVAMSGGVDSSVSAYLLKEQGYKLTGVYMKNWSGDEYGLQGDCPWEEEQADAEKVCEKLGIPFRSFNFEKDYREKVVEYFFAEYEAGRTPNPDVMCNKEIKFELFLNKAIAEGADMIATGHYVRRVFDEETDSYNLLKGVDENKDQSYFLTQIRQDQLEKSLFPVGDLPKAKVREIAKDAGLHNAEKPDSQGICFIGEINVHDFLKQRLGEKTGDIIDADSQKIVGQHKGAHFYTIGQREGIRIGGVPEPYYVVGTDTKKNEVYVAMGSENPRLFKKEVEIQNIHLINSENKERLKSDNLSASIRYRHVPQDGQFVQDNDGNLLNPLVFRFEEPQRAVTAGQSLVLYDGDVCLGGGVIV